MGRRSTTSGAQVVGSVLSRLSHHVAEHFAREEKLLHDSGYRDADDHAAQHAVTLKRLEELRTLATEDDSKAAVAVLEFLKAWFVNHVVGSDLKLRDFFREKGVADLEPGGRCSRLATRTDFLSLKTRVLLVAWAPVVVIAVLLLAIWSTLDKVGRQGDITLAQFSTVSSALIHEMQERGSSALFLGSKGAVRSRTGGAVRPPTAVWSPSARARDMLATLKGANTTASSGRWPVEKLADIRKGTDAQTIPVPQVLGYYTAAIADQLAVVEGMGHLANDPDMAMNLNAYTAILNAKERAGLERATGSAGFAAGAFSQQLHRRLNELGAEQKAFLHVFRITAKPQAIAALDRAQADESEKRVGEWRTVAIESPFTGSLGDIKAPDWFKLTTRRIDQMKTVEDAAAAELMDHARAVLAGHTASAWWQAGLLLVLVGVSALLSLLIVAGLVPPLLAARHATTRMAEGDRTVEIPGQSLRDELGELARAIQFFKERLIAAELMSAVTNVDNQGRIEAMLRKEQAVAEFDERMAKFVEEVGESAQSLMVSAGTMTEVASETASRSDDVAHAASDTSQRVQSTAAATEELASSSANRRQVQTQAGATREAVGQAHAATPRWTACAPRPNASRWCN